MTLRAYLSEIWNNRPLPQSVCDLYVVDTLRSTNIGKKELEEIGYILEDVKEHCIYVQDAERQIADILKKT